MLITQLAQLDSLFNEDDNFIFISRFLVEKFGSITRVQVIQRIYLESRKYPNEEWLSLPKKKFAERDFIFSSRVTSDIEYFKELEIIDTTIKGVPPVTFIKVNLQKLYDFCYGQN